MDPPPHMSGERPPYHRARRPLAALSALAAVAAIGVALLRWRPTRIEIHGASMVPTLMPGDWALASKRRRIRVDDVMVVEHPGRPGYEIVKRVVARPASRSATACWARTNSGSRAIGPMRRPTAGTSDPSDANT